MRTQPLDPTNDDLRSLASYVGRLPSRVPGRRLHRTTLWRWAMQGARAADGRIVKLRTVLVGKGRFTKDPWVLEFIDELSGGPPDAAIAGPTEGRCGARTSRVNDEALERIRRRFR